MRTRNHEVYQAVTGISFRDQCHRHLGRLRPDLSAYIGDGVWVRPDGTAYTDATTPIRPPGLPSRGRPGATAER